MRVSRQHRLRLVTVQFQTALDHGFRVIGTPPLFLRSEQHPGNEFIIGTR